MKMPPPRRAKIEIKLPPNPNESSGRNGFRLSGDRGGDGVVSGHGEQAQTDQQQPGDRAAAESDLQRGIHPLMGRLGRPCIGAHRDHHPDVTGDPGGDPADQKTGGGQQAEMLRPKPGNPEKNKKDRRDNGDRFKLPDHIRLGPFVDRGLNLSHLRGSRIESHHPEGKVEGVSNPHAGADEREEYDERCVLHGDLFSFIYIVMIVKTPAETDRSGPGRQNPTFYGEISLFVKAYSPLPCQSNRIRIE
ncbi:MAG: hypothetical protein MPW15_25130 [Candidatus Manganitrophus sp.]|nr:hypothetical protein [Candidatus Manganitrophus sp.]